MPRPGPANYLENALMGEGSSAGRAADPRLREEDYWTRAKAAPIPPASLDIAGKNGGRLLRWLLGKGEGLLHGVSSAAAMPLAGLAGLHESIGAGLHQLRPVEPVGREAGYQPDPLRAMSEVQDAMTYQPRTPEGKAELERASAAPAKKAADWLFQTLPEKTGEGMQDLGMGALPAAAVVSGLELLPNLLGEKKVPGRRGIGSISWGDMALPEAKAAAAAGEHLRPGSGGHYVGAPANVKSPQALSGMRGALDRAVEQGAFGADWYERARSAISEMAQNDPGRADQFSKLLALYSPQQTPDINMGHMLKQLNDYVLKGEESKVKPFYRQQAEKGRAIMRGESPELGPKVGVYEEHINPNKAEQAKVRGVNDIWMGRAFGYGGPEFASGFKDAQHSFMTGENLLAAERAAAKGLLPEGVEPNVGNVQAAAWSGQRLKQLLAQKGNARLSKALLKSGDLEGALALDKKLKEQAGQSYDTVLPKYTAGETYEEVPGRSTGHMTRAADLPFDKRKDLTDRLAWAKAGESDPLYEALGMAQRSTTEGLGQFTETVKKPLLEPAVRVPGTDELHTGLSHSIAFDNMPDAAKEKYLFGEDDKGTNQGFKKNPEGRFLSREDAYDLVRELGDKPDYFGHVEKGRGRLASEDLRGFVPDGKGGIKPRDIAGSLGVDVTTTDYNPNRTARPMASFAAGAGDFDPASASLLEQTNAFRSAMDAQAAGAYGGVDVGDRSTGDAARVTFKKPLSDAETRALYQKAADAQLDLVDYGGGTFKVTKFQGPEGKRLPKKDFGARLKQLAPALEGADVARGGHVGGYQELPWGAPRSGQVTDWLLGKVEPRVGEKLTSTQRVRDALVRKNVNELQFKQDNPFQVNAPREDLQRLRGMIAVHGLEGVRKMVRDAGGGVAGAAKLGLPAVALGYLGGGDDEAP